MKHNNGASLPLDNYISDLLGIGGFIFLSYGCWLMYEPAGYIVAGVLLIAAAYTIARNTNQPSS